MRVATLAIAGIGLACAAAVHPAAGASTGEQIFQGACATCHAAGSPRVIAGQPLLRQTGAIIGDDPTLAITLVLHGHLPRPEQRGPWMPAFASTLNDAQIADLLNWLRQSAGQSPWPDLPQHVQAIREARP